MSEIRTATIVAESGRTVNLRTRPNGALVDRIPVGVTVTVAAQQDGWVRVTYGGKSGWMMEKFVQSNSAIRLPSSTDTEEPDEDSAEDLVEITLPRSMAEQLRDALGSVLCWG